MCATSDDSIKRSHLARGFTLVELMIVVAIIGVMAAIAVPNYGLMSCRAKQAEAKANGEQIVKVAAASREEFALAGGGFEFVTACSGAIAVPSQRTGISVKGKVRYRYRVTRLIGGDFTLRIDGCGSQVGDVWRRDGGTGGQLVNTSNVCQ